MARTENTKDDSKAAGWRPTPKMIAAAVLLVVLVLFALLNRSKTAIDFFGAKFQSPLWFWLLVMLLLGVAVGSVFPWGRRKR